MESDQNPIRINRTCNRKWKRGVISEPHLRLLPVNNKVGSYTQCIFKILKYCISLYIIYLLKFGYL